MRNYIKGGTAWKNSEDEILKAAVMKYGKNQWARVASLLNRKSAKLCKARWYEWLDPSIKKTEWTREEEEKLLHLAKLMPTQWRTIAPIVGRTASQCLEHYEKLLDQAQEREGGYDAAEDPRKLRPGEIDSNPETKPARPDAIDMDEDEKEMLSEARARLANTRGKKAKRKAREKQLEEAKRLASLQKRRELKAAGIVTTLRKKVLATGYDPSQEIPFQKNVPSGFFDTSAEKAESETKELINVALQRMEGRRRSEIEEESRKLDIKKQKEKEKRNLPEAIMETTKAIGAQQGFMKRARFSIPEPQLSETELEEIAKLGSTAEGIQEAQASTGSKATQKLLADYSKTPAPFQTPAMRTPMRTASSSGGDSIMMEARNLRAISSQATPLLGGSNVALGSTFGDFAGATPRAIGIQATPNPLATPFKTAGGAAGASGSMTNVSTFSGAAATPRIARDELRINDERDLQPEANPRAEKQRREHIKKKVSLGLDSLPEPKNEYAFTAPADMDVDDDDEEEGEDHEEDAEDLIARGEAARKAQEEARLRMRSQAVQRDLPRPIAANFSVLMSDEEFAALDPNSEKYADELIKRETTLLIQSDAVEHPFPVQLLPIAAAKKLPKSKPIMDETLTEDELAQAKKLVEEQLAEDFGNAAKEEERELVLKEIDELLSSQDPLLIFNPKTEKYQIFSKASRNEKIEALEHEFRIVTMNFEEEYKRATKLEQKATILMAGYTSRNNNLNTQLLTAYNQIDEARIQLACFDGLEKNETQAISSRLGHLRSEVNDSKLREKNLQDTYKSLTTRIEKYKSLLSLKK